MKIALVGAGYVGLAFAYLFANLTDHKIVVVDNNKEKIASLNGGEEILKNEFFPKPKSPIIFTDDYELAFKDSDFIFVAVDTPCNDDGSINLSNINSLINPITSFAKNNVTIVIKSTVIPGFCRDFAKKINLKVISNPEFLRSHFAYNDALNPSRVIIGENFHNDAEDILNLYRKIYDSKLILVMKSESAELCKYASNSFLATKVSFINEISNISRVADADIADVITGLSFDPRIGKDYLKPGLGFGGGCIPKDLSAFISYSRDCGYNPELLESVANVNINQPSNIVNFIQSSGHEINNKKILIVGCAFKSGSSSTLESPSLKLIAELKKHSASCFCYDPNVDFFKIDLPFYNDLSKGINECDLIIVVDKSLFDFEKFHKEEKIIVI